MPKHFFDWAARRPQNLDRGPLDRKRIMACGHFALLLSALLFPLGTAAGQEQLLHIKPSETDASIKRFDFPSVVTYDKLTPTQQLLVFFPGTGGKPDNLVAFLRTAAAAGYRVISLAYIDEPAVDQVCPKTNDPQCAAEFRQRRIYGQTTASRLIDDRPEESIVNRLTKLILYLAKAHPTQGWESYLDGHDLNWSRLVLAGHSQGGGMATFIAKKHNVARVITFSGGWDEYTSGTGQKQLAPWYQEPSATPASHYWGTYHAKEPTSQLIATSYEEMGIPSDHIRLTTAEPKQAGNYHPSVVGNPENRPIWEFLLGRSP